MRKHMILFLGRSIEGILRDAEREFELEGFELVIVTRDNDRLQPPAGFDNRVCPISDFAPATDIDYTIIANGGSSAQFVPVLKALVELNCPLQVFDLQRDGCQKLW